MVKGIYVIFDSSLVTFFFLTSQFGNSLAIRN